jgi:hypothetical protein
MQDASWDITAGGSLNPESISKYLSFSDLMTEWADPAGSQTLLPEERGGNPLWDAARALGEQQYSGILETEEGFSILRRLPLSTEAVKEAYFDRLLRSAAEQSEVTAADGYGAVDPESFARRFLPEPAGENGGGA